MSRNTLEQLAGVGIVVVVLVGFVFLLSLMSGTQCISGDTEMWCGMRW